MNLNKLKETLLKERETLKAYIQGKLDNDRDWHAISDAANDLRDIDAKLEVINMIPQTIVIPAGFNIENLNNFPNNVSLLTNESEVSFKIPVIFKNDNEE